MLQVPVVHSAVGAGGGAATKAAARENGSVEHEHAQRPRVHRFHLSHQTVHQRIAAETHRPQRTRAQPLKRALGTLLVKRRHPICRHAVRSQRPLQHGESLALAPAGRGHACGKSERVLGVEHQRQPWHQPQRGARGGCVAGCPVDAGV